MLIHLWKNMFNFKWSIKNIHIIYIIHVLTSIIYITHIIYTYNLHNSYSLHNLHNQYFFIKIKESSIKINRGGSRTSIASEKELCVVVSNGYQLLNNRGCPKSPGLASNKILLLSDESLLKGEDRRKYFS